MEERRFRFRNFYNECKGGTLLAETSRDICTIIHGYKIQRWKIKHRLTRGAKKIMISKGMRILGIGKKRLDVSDDLSAGIKRAGFVIAAAFQRGPVIARKKDEFSGTNEGLPKRSNRADLFSTRTADRASNIFAG